MCMGGSAPSSPPPPPAPVAPPQPVDNTSISSSEESKKAAQDANKKAQLAKGQSSTINTDPLGDTSAAPVQKTSLLGSGG